MTMRNRMRDMCTSGSVGGLGGRPPTWSDPRSLPHGPYRAVSSCAWVNLQAPQATHLDLSEFERVDMFAVRAKGDQLLTLRTARDDPHGCIGDRRLENLTWPVQHLPGVDCCFLRSPQVVVEIAIVLTEGASTSHELLHLEAAQACVQAGDSGQSQP